MRDTATNGQQGLFEPVWRLVDHSLRLVQNRLELISVEAQEEKIRLFEMLLLASAIIVLATLALALTTVGIILYFWETGADLAIALLAISYATAAGFAWRAFQARLKAPRPFSASIEELQKDRECIRN
jgi:uncharacterized membrane protein YqjE